MGGGDYLCRTVGVPQRPVPPAPVWDESHGNWVFPKLSDRERAERLAELAEQRAKIGQPARRAFGVKEDDDGAR